MKWIGKVIGISCILYGLYSFDSADFRQAAISSILILTGVSSLLSETQSENLKKIANASKYTAAVIAIVLLIRILLFG